MDERMCLILFQIVIICYMNYILIHSVTPNGLVLVTVQLWFKLQYANLKDDSVKRIRANTSEMYWNELDTIWKQTLNLLVSWVIVIRHLGVTIVL